VAPEKVVQSRGQAAADRALVQRVVVASALVGAALIHGSVAGEHFGEWVPAGAFFLTVQLVELVLALLAAVAWDRRVAELVVVTGVGTVVVWLVSRTIGMPIGPADFRVPEPVGLSDLLCGVLELASVAAAAPSLWSTAVARSGRPGPRAVASATVAVVAALSLTAWAMVPAVSGGGHEHVHVPSAAH
jgi:hypothetical protein